MAKVALAVGCHPDDIEFMTAGTLIMLKKAGYEIHYMNLANGSCGTHQYNTKDIIRIRRQESINAAKKIGAIFHESLVDDLDVFYDKKSTLRMGAVIRDIAPEIVLTHSLVEYMEDHANTCRLTVTATFCRGMRNFITIPKKKTITNDVALYHSMPYGLHDPLRKKVRAGLYVDVSSTIELKKEMLACHKSQKDWLDVSQGQNSYLITQENMTKDMGSLSKKFKYAEGFTRHLHLGFCSRDFNPLADALGKKVVIDKKFEENLA